MNWTYYEYRRYYECRRLLSEECERCLIDCSNYVRGDPPFRSAFSVNNMDVDEIEKSLSLKYVSLPPEIESMFIDVIRSAQNSVINRPDQARKECIEYLGIFCCRDPIYKGYIFYNTDRINDYVESLGDSILTAAFNIVGNKVGGGSADQLKRILEDQGETLKKEVKEISKSVIITSIILHERFHWADISTNKDFCDEKCRCEEEARATAFEIKGTVDLIRGKKIADWQRFMPVSGLPQSLIEDVLLSWRPERSYRLLMTLLAYELSVEAIVLHQSMLPCYGDFYRFLKGKDRKLGSVKINKINDTHWEVVLPWIGVHMYFHAHDFLYAHLHDYELVDNLELKLNNPPDKVRLEELKEVWGYCR